MPAGAALAPPHRLQISAAALAVRAGQARGHDLVDAAAVEVDDLEAPALRIDRLAGRRQMVEMRQQVAGDGLVVPALRQVDAEMVGHLVGRHVAGKQP